MLLKILEGQAVPVLLLAAALLWMNSRYEALEARFEAQNLAHATEMRVMQTRIDDCNEERVKILIAELDAEKEAVQAARSSRSDARRKKQSTTHLNPTYGR